MPLPLLSNQRQMLEKRTIKPTIIANAEYIENPRASRSEEPKIENLKALIIYKIGLASEIVCQNGGNSRIE